MNNGYRSSVKDVKVIPGEEIFEICESKLSSVDGFGIQKRTSGGK